MPLAKTFSALTKTIAAFTYLGTFCGVAPSSASHAVGPANHASLKPDGIAWRVLGGWRQLPQTDPIRTGDPIHPGALLRPADDRGAHSITLLLPDGQRILYECFTEEDCARGFRVPALTEAPAAFAAALLARMGAELRGATGEAPPAGPPLAAPRTTLARREETVAILAKDAKDASTATASLPVLPDGDYRYDLKPFDRDRVPRFHLPLSKTSADCVFAVPGAGLYEITVWDERNTPRIDLLLAAVAPAQAPAFVEVPRARKLLAGWDALYYGWPVHDLMRAYLRSLMEAQPGALPSKGASVR